MGEEPHQLHLASESRLDPPTHRALVTHNPSIELAARAAGPKSVQVWRANGQTVSKSSQRGERESVEALRWRSDGKPESMVPLVGIVTAKHGKQCQEFC